jgi:hypothetical protein
MTKPTVTAVSSKSDFMFKNASSYNPDHVLCLASHSTWTYFDTYMKPFADAPITVSAVNAGILLGAGEVCVQPSFRMPGASTS